jgi:ATP-binding cassette subfamily B protein
MQGHDDEVGLRRADARLLRRLGAYLVPQRGAFTVALFLFPAATALNLAQPWLVKVAIDEHLAPGRLEGLWVVATLFAGVMLAEYAARFAQVYLMQRVGQRALADLRRSVFAHVQGMHAGWFDRQPVGRILTRVVNDVESLGEIFASGAVSLVGDVLTLAGIVAVMLVLDVRLTLASFAVVPLVVLVVLALRPMAREAFREVRRRLSRINAFLHENLSGMHVVQLFQRERRNVAAFDALNRGFRDANYRAIFADVTLYSLVEMVTSIGIACVLYFGGGATVQGAMALGTLVAFIEYIQRFFVPLRDLSSKYTFVQAAMASAERIFAVLDDAPGIVDPPDARPCAGLARELRFDDVWVEYRPGEPVLRGLDLAVRRGERVAVVGATGAGKTTLARIINRSYDVSRGQVTLDGLDVRALALADLRRAVTVVPQDVALFTGTLAENVTLGDPAIGREALDDAARAVGLDRVVARLPDGYAHALRERGANLSVGERQLIGFARALARRPSFLILDEATSSVDPESERQILAATEALLQGRTAIVIAHRLTTIRMVDRIVVLHAGRVVEQGAHEDLLARGGVYSRLYRLQFASESSGNSTS